MQVKYDSVGKSTGAPNTNVVTGLKFRPDALILWATTNTVDGTIAQYQQSHGFSDGTNHYSVCGTSETAVTTSNSNRRHASKGLTFLNLTQTLIAECDVSFQSDGFTLTWTTNNSAAYIIHWLAIEGVDAEVSFFVGNGTTGEQTITTTLAPSDVLGKNAALFASCGLTASPPGNSGFSASAFGFATAADAQGMATYLDRNAQAAPMETRHAYASTFIYGAFSGTTDTLAKQVEFASFDVDTPGFVIDWVVNTTSNHRVGYLFMKVKDGDDGFFDVQTRLQPTSVQEERLAMIGKQFDPIASLFVSSGTTTDGSAAPDTGFCMGASTKDDLGGSIWIGSEDAASPATVVRQRTDQSKSFMLKDATVAVDFNAPDAECDSKLKQRAATLDWTTADATAREFAVLLFGNISEIPKEWLGKYPKRLPITIDSSRVDAILSGFPVLLALGTASGINAEDLSDVFQSVVDNGGRVKIAVTTVNGSQECEVETERWDAAGQKAWLWVRVPEVAATFGEDTVLWLYYGRGVPDNQQHRNDFDSSGAEGVWDDNYKMVQHMGDDKNLTEVQEELSGLANNAAFQGVASDGEYWYLLSSQWTGTPKDLPTVPFPLGNSNARNIIRKVRISDGVEVLIKGGVNEDAVSSVVIEDQPPGCEDCVAATSSTFSSGNILNGPHGPRLYVVCRARSTGDKRVTVVEYDPEDLTEISETILGSDTVGAFDGGTDGYGIAEGVDWRNGRFWVVFGGKGGSAGNFGLCAIGEYDRNWGEIKVYDLFTVTSGGFGGQDILWFGDHDIVINHHEGPGPDELQRWKFLGQPGGFVQRSAYDQLPDGASFAGQGFAFKDGYIYFVGRTDDVLLKAEFDTDRTSDTRDTTSNGNHGEKTAAASPIQSEQAGMIGEQQDFNGSNRVDCGQDVNLRVANVSIEAITRTESFAVDGVVVHLQLGFELRVQSDGTIRIITNGLSPSNVFTSVTTVSIDTVYSIACGFDGGEIKLFINGVEITDGDFPVTGLSGSLTYNAAHHHAIGIRKTPTESSPFNGKIDEVRVSDVSRADEWFKAGYFSNIDDLVFYGTSELRPKSVPMSSGGNTQVVRP